MSHIDDQLRSEIASLEEHISRTEDRFMATRLVAQLLPPLQRLAGQLSEAEQERALSALRRARDRFNVNGQLSTDIDALLGRSGDTGVAGDGRDDSYAEALLPPGDDPGDTAEGTAQVLFEDEDEETEEGEGEAPARELDPVPEGDALPHAGAGDDLFAAADPEEPTGDEAPLPPQEEEVLPADADEAPPSGPGAPDLPSDELFEVPARPRAGGDGRGSWPAPDRPLRSPREPAPGMPRRELEEVAASVSIFSDTVALDDLQAALDIAVPSQDLAQLENRLRARLSDLVVASLRESRLAEGQYILMPRIARFIHGGAVVPCTLRNLAKSFFKLFGDLRDLRPYVNDRLMTAEVPEMGWSLITPEAPRESLDKSHMEQNQYIRYLATSLGIPSHLVRRRTLVEAVYDAVVGRLVLGKTLQRQTLDWTASSATKSDFLCMYSADEGIRIRQLARTTRHPALGACPNW